MLKYINENELKIGGLYKIHGHVFLNEGTKKLEKLSFSGIPIELSDIFMLLDFPKKYPSKNRGIIKEQYFYYVIKVLLKHEIKYIIVVDEMFLENLEKITV